MAAGTPGTISNLTPALAHAAASATAPFSSGSPGNSRTASWPPLAACTSARADPGPVGRVGQHGVRAHVAPRRRLQLGSGDHQAGLAEQFGGPHGQQSLVTGARTDQGDPARAAS